MQPTNQSLEALCSFSKRASEAKSSLLTSSKTLIYPQTRLHQALDLSVLKKFRNLSEDVKIVRYVKNAKLSCSKSEIWWKWLKVLKKSQKLKHDKKICAKLTKVVRSKQNCLKLWKVVKICKVVKIYDRLQKLKKLSIFNKFVWRCKTFFKRI